MTLAKTQRSPRAEIQFQELGFSGIPNIKTNVEICIPPLAIFASWREIFLVKQHVTTNIIDIPQPIHCPAQPLGAQLTFDEPSRGSIAQHRIRRIDVRRDQHVVERLIVDEPIPTHVTRGDEQRLFAVSNECDEPSS
jgi:hypothetical protein